MVKKLSKKEIIYLCIMNIAFFTFVIVLTRFKYAYGSSTDWKSQHWVIPEYFRNLFYETNVLFPEFSKHIGGGQNIYNFAYYGLYNPYVLFSYILPFVKMSTYIIATSILSVSVGFVAFYIWVRRKYTVKIAMLAGAFYLLAAPIIYHSHRHVMFVNYLPFLMFALNGVDSYICRGKSKGMIFFSLLIILTSFYFSVSSLLVIFLYALSYYYRINKKPSFKGVMLFSTKIAGRLAISISIAMVLILPTFYALLNGRNLVNKKEISPLSIFIPKAHVSFIAYDSYSMGLSGIALLAIVVGVFSIKKQVKFLSISIACVLIFPIFVYMLNGGQYIDAKVLIPFIPITLLIVCDFIDGFLRKQEKNNYIPAIAITLLFTVVGCILFASSDFIVFLLLIDIIIVISMLLIAKKNKSLLLLCGPSVGVSMIICCVVNFSDLLILQDNVDTMHSKVIDEMVEEVLMADKGIYRFGNTIDIESTVNHIYNARIFRTTIYSSTNNRDYNNFYFNQIGNTTPFRNATITPQANNILFNNYMGEKYFISDFKIDRSGFSLIDQKENYFLYQNENAYPLAYATKNIMSTKEYQQLSYPLTIEALMKYIIVEKECDKTDFVGSIKKKEIAYADLFKDVPIGVKNEQFHVISTEDFGSVIELKKPIKDELLFISFEVSHNKLIPEAIKTNGAINDLWITINGMKNVLTSPTWKYYNNNNHFQYVLSSTEEIEKLVIAFSKGDYFISNLQVHTVDETAILPMNQLFDAMEFDANEKRNNYFSGRIDVTEDSIFQATIPYDKGFRVFIDKKEVEYMKSDTAFIAFWVEKGEHIIEIAYHPPFLNIAKGISLVGLILFGFLMWKERNVRKEERFLEVANL